MITTFVGLLLPIFAPRDKLALGRRMFWLGLTVAVTSAFFIPLPSDWRAGAELSGLVAFMMLTTAYFTSPYLKFGGKVRAAFTMDVEAENPGGRERVESRRGGVGEQGLLTSAPKLWWFMAAAMTLCAFNIGQFVVARENPRLAVAMAVAIVVFSGGFGFVDGRAGNPIARRQKLPFVVVAVVTFGVFAVLYLGAYAAGRRNLRRGDRNEA